MDSVAATDFDLMSRYFSEEPWGTWRDNAHAGQIAAAICNSFGGMKQSISFHDFILVDNELAEQRRREFQKTKSDQLISILKAVAVSKK